MIKYIQHKPINQIRIQKLLGASSNDNHFTNNGPIKRALEDYLHSTMELPASKRVLCVSSGTSALHTLMFLYEKKAGRPLKWVTPSFTFPSCVVNRNNTRAVDIDPLTYSIPEHEIGDADGIIITNLFGVPLDFDYFKYSHKVVITDNASSFMSTDNDQNICLLGDAAFASLHHTKSLGFGEGGFIVLDSNLYDDAQSITGFGFEPPNREYKSLSSNFRMSDISAAYIMQHIEGYDRTRHFELQMMFKEAVDCMGGVRLFDYKEGTFYGNLPIVFDCPMEIENFRVAGIEANKYYLPLDSSHVNSKFLYDRIINLPLHIGISDEEMIHMIDTLRRM